MTIGQGNVFVLSRSAQSGAPFVAGSADNGLSVDPVTSKIVLGDDTGLGGAAQLLSTRLIDLKGFILAFLDQFGEVDISQSTVSISGDESNGFPGQLFLLDINDANNTGFAAHVPSVGFSIFANVNNAGGNTTGIGCERTRVVVSKNLTAVPAADTGALLQLDDDISTGDPGSGKGVWMLGKKIAGAVALDAANYVEVKIDGVPVKLGIVV